MCLHGDGWIKMVGTGTRLTEGGQNPRGTVAWQSSRGEENKMKVQGWLEDAKTGSLARPQNGVGGVQSDYSGGREGRRKKRRKEGVDTQDLSSSYLTSCLGCAGDDLSEHGLS